MLHFVVDRVKRDGFDADGMSPPSLVVRLSRKKHPPGQRSWPGCLQLGLSRLRLERAILIDELDLLAQPSTDHGVVNIEAASTGNINLDWTLGGSGYRHVWVHRNGGLFFGAAKESDQGDSGVQSIGSAMVDVTPGDSFEPIASHTSGSARNVDHDEITWFAIAVVASRCVRDLSVRPAPPGTMPWSLAGAPTRSGCLAGAGFGVCVGSRRGRSSSSPAGWRNSR